MMNQLALRFVLPMLPGLLAGSLLAEPAAPLPEIPDAEIAAAYERAAVQNVLAAVNPKVFSGYWSVCADGQGFGYGNTYPSLDGQQMTDALLWLGQVEVVKANWDYVRSFQRPNGELPLAIFPSNAGKQAAPGQLPTDQDNGGLYQHWVPGNPLAALADPTYIQNADVILEAWARAQMGDAQGLLDGLRKVSQVGRAGGYFWRERYHPDGKGGVVPAGAEKYCEYPANLIRIVQRFLFGVDPRLDGSLVLMPTATAEFWEQGFGQTLVGSSRKLTYRMQRSRTEGTYHGTAPLRLGLRFLADMVPIPERALINGQPAEMVREKDLVFLALPAASPQEPCRFEVACGPAPNSAADQGPDRQSLAFDVKLDVVKQELHPDFCWFHPRVAAVPGAGRDGRPAVVMTLQKHLGVSDHYSGLWMMRTDDLGQTWTGPTEIPELAWVTEPDGVVRAVADVTPGWHPQTGKLIAMGCTVRYGKNGEQLSDVPRFSQTTYAVYDPTTAHWSKWQVLELPDDDKFNMARNACAQWLVLQDSTLLVPIYFATAPNVPASVTVLHCAFDGQKLTYLKHGDELSLNVVRGLCEPSLIAFRDRFYLTIRNDIKGYVTVSNDGLHYQPMKPWTFDDGSELGSYNTQQHWLAHHDGIFLAYTRRGADNDHIPRNRAPIFLAQVDPERLCVVRNSERAIIPERGVMLGNFGASAIDACESWVTDAEYMVKGQTSPRGANGSVFAARVLWSKPNDLAPGKAR